LTCHHQLHLPVDKICSQSPLTSQPKKSTWDVKPSVESLTISSKQEDARKDDPISRWDQYVIPFQTIYTKLGSKKSNIDLKVTWISESQLNALEEPSKQPLPNLEYWPPGDQSSPVLASQISSCYPACFSAASGKKQSNGEELGRMGSPLMDDLGGEVILNSVRVQSHSLL
ncbi:uncharacterized protein VP01_5636g1, partial [Puccinia sorghi]